LLNGIENCPSRDRRGQDGLGRENPTVGILDQIAQALDAGIVEFFVVPNPDELPPKPLPGGRRAKT
jgi:hypothetical protein